MITVMGATGQVGGQAVRRLLAAGERVRAVGRDPRRLADLAAAGAEAVAGDAADSAFLTEAFRGADAVHTMQPYDPRSLDYLAQQDRLGESVVTAVLGAALGRPDLTDVQLPGAEIEAVLVRGGLSPDVAALHVQLAAALSDGRVATQQGRSAATTTPTRFEDVAPELVRAAASVA